MQLNVQIAALAEIKTDWLIVGVWEDEALPPAVAQLDAKLGGVLARVREAGDVVGKAKETTPLLDCKGVVASRVMVVGLGKRAKADRVSLVNAAAAAARAITGKQVGRIAMALPERYPDLEWEEVAEKVGIGLQQGSFGPGLFKTKPNRYAPHELLLVAPPGAPEQDVRRGVERAAIVGEAVRLARELVNLPPCDLY